MTAPPRPGLITEALDGVARQLDSPREVAQSSDLVIVAVVSADQAEQVLVGEDGVLTVLMVGGAGDDVTRALPVLEGFAGSVIHCGPVGNGMVAKLARNAAQCGRWAVMAEAASLAAAGGVAPGRPRHVR